MISLRDLTKAYGDFELDSDIELGDEITAVIGPSGSGKSTLLELISGFESPDSGTVSLDGRPLDGVAPERRNIGMVFQNPTLFPHLTVRENIEYGAAVSDEEIRDLCELLEIAEFLESDRSPETLSGGEKRRVSVARAIVTAPDALLLDEPTTGLDEPIRRRLKYAFRRVLDDLDIPCVYVTHDQNEAAVVADSVAVMRNGEILQHGPYGEIRESPRSEFVADFVGIENVIPGEIGPDRTVVDIGVARVQPARTALEAAAGSATDVSVGIAPESVRISGTTSGGGGSSAESQTRESNPQRINCIDCVAERVIPERGAKTVFLDCGLQERFKAMVDSNVPVTEGDDVTARFDASDVVVI